MNFKKITLFLIATVILLTLVSCTNTNDKNTNKQIINSNVVETNDEYTNKQIVKSYVFNNKYGTYYTGSSLFLLDGENVVKVKSNTDSKNADSLSPYYYPGICIGETIYGPIGDIRTALYKSNFVSKDTVETTEWVTNETLLKSFISQKDTSDSSYYEKVGNKLNCIDEEIPFKLPEGWAFIRLKTAWELISGRDLSPSDYNDKNNGIPYITGASNFKNGHVSLVRWTPVPQVITQKGDLLLTCKGTIGEIAYNNFGKAHIARQIMAIRNNYSLNVDFLALCIEYSMTKIQQAAKGLIPGISREDILNLVIPIPPTKEQEKICDKLKVTFSAIKHIEKAS